MADKRVAKILRFEREWLELPRNALETLTQSFAKQLRSGKGNAKGLTVPLRSLQWRHAIDGMSRVMDGHEAGWAQLRRAFELEWWRYRINPAGPVSIAAPLLAQLIVQGADDRAAWLARAMIDDIGQQAGNPFVWSSLPFARFVVTLWCRERGEEPPDFAETGSTSLGLFGSILDRWHDETLPPGALEALCDHRLKMALAEADHDFEFVPYILYPVEILLILHLRAQQKRAAPDIEHPLMATPLASPPGWGAISELEPDPLLDQLLARAQREGHLPPEGVL